MTTPLEDAAKIARLFLKHVDAGHTESNPKLITDAETLVVDLHRVIYSVRPPATIDERLSFLVSTVAVLDRRTEPLVSQIAQDTDTAVKAAADRVIAALGDVAALKQAVTDAQAAQAAAEAATAAAQAALDAATADAAADATTLAGTIATADTIAPVTPTP